MPTYEYACAACGHEFEVFQSMKDAALTKCPSCGEDRAKRQISKGTGFILKGGGWYSDLYASSGNKPSASSSGEGSSTTTSTPASTETSTTPKTSTGSGSSGTSGGGTSSST